MAITAQRELFIQEYIKCRVGAEAARRAGYSKNGAGVTASKILDDPDVAAEIKRRTEEGAMELGEALKLLADHARSTMEDFISFNEGPYPDFTLDLDKARERGVLHLIKKLKYDKDGNPEIELHSSQDALKSLVQLLTAGPSGREGDPLHVKHIMVKGYATVTPDDWDDEPTDSADSNL